MDCQLTREEILNQNPGIDKKVVESYEKLAAELRKAGREMKPKYSISPPLGGPVRAIHIYGKP